MNQVKVSVIIPVYNVENYLRECLDSLVNQTLKEIEIICVDDGSTDSSLDILKEYREADERVVIVEQKNLFAGVARNNGLKIAKGEYVIFLDSDDFFDRTLLEKTYNKGASKDADIVFFGGKKYHETLKEIQEAPWYFNRALLPEKEVFSRKDAPETLLRITAPMPWTKLFRREFVLNEGLQFQPLHNSNDVFFVMTAISTANRITYVDDDLVYYRVGTTQNLQSTKSKNPLCFLKAYEGVYNELSRRGFFDEVKKSFIDVTISGCEHNIETNKDYDVRMTIIEALAKSDFVKNVLLAEDEEYYSNKTRYYKVLGCQYALEQYKSALSLSKDKQTRCIKQNELEAAPKVSVIIPVYNVEPYLKECLDSILNQTLSDIEVICINDGSRDNSLELLKELTKNEKRVSVYTQLNAGPSYTRNVGIREAKGEYIYFMDSDDILELNAIEKLYSTAVDNGNADVIMFNAKSFTDSDDCSEEFEKYKIYYLRDRVYNGVFSGDVLANSMISQRDYRCSPCLQFLRREHIINNNISFYEGILHEDELFTLSSLLRAEKAMFINDALFNRRVHPDSIMTSTVSFKNIYGYFCSCVEFMKIISTQELSNSGLLAIDSRLNGLLRSARKNFNKITPAERYARFGIPKPQQPLFEQLVVIPATQDLMLYRAEQKLKKKDKRIKRLKKKTNSRAFKIYTLLISPITKIKKLLKR